ncbi:uncharacterized protein G2W53_041030 [Senna tora]|uniref:Uncharacterized protein n=1 Tax=Senna tora TaxID=362788 RepID=A0A834W2I7_9FABA|nr:uncharacterized protein G2W53_041030 [Senna tora]
MAFTPAWSFLTSMCLVADLTSILWVSPAIAMCLALLLLGRPSVAIWWKLDVLNIVEYGRATTLGQAVEMRRQRDDQCKASYRDDP